jgi:Dyp-type peroxidase family
MSARLNLPDIQGDILRAYGRFGFPLARHYFLHIRDGRAAEGRAFIDRIRPRVTSAVRWQVGPDAAAPDAVPPPRSTLNIGFGFFGLVALGLPTRTLSRMPAEFIDGMAKRNVILGDCGSSAPECWEPIWRRSMTEESRRVHLWIAIHARSRADMDEADLWLRACISDHAEGVLLLDGQGPTGAADHQEASALMETGPDGTPRPSGKEHFGFVDGIGDPVFQGRYEPDVQARLVKGRGKLMPDQTWQPIATGEFLLGHPDESQELPPVAPPWELTRNGSFMVYRKLHQNTKSFSDYISVQAKTFAAIMDLSEEAARETLMAKIAGRWRDGIPLIAAPTYEDWRRLQGEWSDIPELQARRGTLNPEGRRRLDAYREMLSDFTFGEDKGGVRCPYGAHLRRVNTRDMLDPLLSSANPSERSGSALNKRRHILRRGLPYGTGDSENPSDEGEHGVIFIAICASLSRQFEFLQQQWIQYGLDFDAGNDTCPLVGNHDRDTKLVIAADPEGDKPPFICADIPQFVTTRGGDYFFLPGLNGLRMIAEGSVDPT